MNLIEIGLCDRQNFNPYGIGIIKDMFKTTISTNNILSMIKYIYIYIYYTLYILGTFHFMSHQM